MAQWEELYIMSSDHSIIGATFQRKAGLAYEYYSLGILYLGYGVGLRRCPCHARRCRGCLAPGCLGGDLGKVGYLLGTLILPSTRWHICIRIYQNLKYVIMTSPRLKCQGRQGRVICTSVCIYILQISSLRLSTTIA